MMRGFYKDQQRVDKGYESSMGNRSVFPPLPAPTHGLSQG
ncbi:hypothetical protein CCP3SC15_70023 [Gammaproteobacteria bacterium]